MPQLTMYHLTFPHGLHVGAGGVESVEESRESVPSDTLFAALLDTWRHLGREVSEILPGENGAPAFKVTSAFPFAGGVRFFPKPVDLRELFSPEKIKDFGAGKNIKKIRYLSDALFNRARAGEFLDDELKKNGEDEWACKFSLQGGALWLTKAEIEQLPESIRFYTEKINGEEKKQRRPNEAVMRQKVYDSQTAPRVTVDRINSAPNLFQSERVTFTAGCGLWFGVARNSISQADFENLLTVLGDSGLGGERTAGYGHFTHEQKSELPLNEPQISAYLLSRWHPAKDEVSLLKNSAYKLEAVEGWLRTPENAAAQRRKRVWLVAEGSLIAGNPQGDAVDVRPEYDVKSGETIPHPVYRPGFALALDWKQKVTHE